MIRYFPFQTNHFEHSFGVRPLPVDSRIIETTEHYEEEIHLKRVALDESPTDYSVGGDDCVDSQQAAFRWIVEQSEHLSWTVHDETAVNELTGESISINESASLLSISKHVQEDLAIMRADAEAGFPLAVGVVVFPSGWSVAEKVGQSVLTIHSPVPEFEIQLAPQTDRLMRRLKTNRPVWRMNWGVRPSAQLDQSPKHADRLRAAARSVTASDVGDQCHFRVERQTLTRLSTGDILFTIHTHQCPLAELSKEQRTILAGVLTSCPESTLKYKGIQPMKSAILEHLAS